MLLVVFRRGHCSCWCLLVLLWEGSPNSSGGDLVEGLPPGMTKFSGHAYVSGGAGRGRPSDSFFSMFFLSFFPSSTGLSMDFDGTYYHCILLLHVSLKPPLLLPNPLNLQDLRLSKIHICIVGLAMKMGVMDMVIMTNQ